MGALVTEAVQFLGFFTFLRFSHASVPAWSSRSWRRRVARAPHRAAAASRGPRVARHGHSTGTAVHLMVARFPGVPLRGSWAGVMGPAALARTRLGASCVRWSLHKAETCTGSRIPALPQEKVLSFAAATNPAGSSRFGKVLPCSARSGPWQLQYCFS